MKYQNKITVNITINEGDGEEYFKILSNFNKEKILYFSLWYDIVSNENKFKINSNHNYNVDADEFYSKVSSIILNKNEIDKGIIIDEYLMEIIMLQVCNSYIDK